MRAMTARAGWSGLCALCALCAPAAAQMYGPGYAKCGGAPTAAVVDCVNASARAWDRRLNASYQALMKRSEPGQREPLKAAQREWIRYRDANCRFYGLGPGSVAQVDAAECLRAMVQQRTCEIEAANSGEAGPGEGCRP